LHMRIHEHISCAYHDDFVRLSIRDKKKQRLSTVGVYLLVCTVSTCWYALQICLVFPRWEWPMNLLAILQLYFWYRGMRATGRRKYSKRRRSREFWLVKDCLVSSDWCKNSDPASRWPSFLTLRFWFLNGSLPSPSFHVILDLPVRPRYALNI
jgi:hypothetical protein